MEKETLDEFESRRLPFVALPCIAFAVGERELINKYGFLSFPQFLDNHYVADLVARPSWLEKNIEKYSLAVLFAIYPDYHYEDSLYLLKKYPNIKWIFPLHRKRERNFAEAHFNWIGFPHRQLFRDYTLSWFIRNTRNKKRWYLGFWNESNPRVLFAFDGLDTTIPETYSGKYGKIWKNWKRCGHKSIPLQKYKTKEMLEMNIRNFRQALISLFDTGILPLTASSL